jgi:hypothetical protein
MNVQDEQVAVEILDHQQTASWHTSTYPKQADAEHQGYRQAERFDHAKGVLAAPVVAPSSKGQHKLCGATSSA